MCLNGSLAGLVAITAGCDAVNVFGSFVIGILSGCMVCFIVWLLDYKLKIDDPVGAVAVHFGNGLLGILLIFKGFFGVKDHRSIVAVLLINVVVYFIIIAGIKPVIFRHAVFCILYLYCRNKAVIYRNEHRL